MTYSMSFKGSFAFADAHCLEAGIDGLVGYQDDDESSVLELHHLAIEGLKVGISWEGSASASSSFGTAAALRLLAEHAKSGSVKASFEGDPSESIRSGGRRNSKGLPPRHHRWEIYAAAKAGNAEALRGLLARGVSLLVDYPTYYWKTSSLHLAAESGSAEAVRAILVGGAEVDRPSGRNDETALGVAENREVVAVLLAAGANVNALVEGKRPIEHACARGRLEVAEALLDAGALLPSTEEGLAAMLAEIARGGGIALLRRLIELDGPSVRKAMAHAEVMAGAVEKGDPVLVDLLLENGAVLPDSFIKDAVEAGAVELLKMALRAPDAAKRCGLSSAWGDPMCIAAREGNVAVMEVLAAHGVPVMPEVPGDLSPLHTAAVFSKGAPSVRWLLDRGVPVDTRNAEGDTALARACVGSGPKESMAMLLAAGADPEAVPDDYRGLLKGLVKTKRRKAAAAKKTG